MDSENLLWRMRKEIGLFCQFLWWILIFKRKLNLSILTALQPWVMVAKNIFPFAIVTDGCKKVNFMEFFNQINIFSENFLVRVSKMLYSWENPVKLASLQPSVTVAKGKISFATMIHGCEGYFSLCNHDWQLRKG